MIMRRVQTKRAQSNLGFRARGKPLGGVRFWVSLGGVGKDLHESIYDSSGDDNTTEPNVYRGKFGSGRGFLVHSMVKESKYPLTDHAYHDDDTKNLMPRFKTFCL